MAEKQLRVALSLTLLIWGAFMITPSVSLISGTADTFHPVSHGAFYIKSCRGEIKVYCTGNLISNNAVLTSCHCLNQALQQVTSQQGAYYGGEVRYALGQLSLDPAAFNAQKAAGTVYDAKIDYANITCPPGADLSDKTNFPDDIAVVSIPAVNTTALGLDPVILAKDALPLSCVQPANITSEGWGSACSCDMNVNTTRNFAPATIVECQQTDSTSQFTTECNPNVFCTQFANAVQLTSGDSGGSADLATNSGAHILFGVISRQYKTRPYGTGCSLQKLTQLNTWVKPYVAWIKKWAPSAMFVSTMNILKM